MLVMGAATPSSSNTMRVIESETGWLVGLGVTGENVGLGEGGGVGCAVVGLGVGCGLVGSFFEPRKEKKR